jgi:hypothetical protein
MKQIRPIPYYTQMDDWEMKQCAKELRNTLIPPIKRRLPMHHLSGLSHQAIIDYVAKWKKEYRYFFRSDILKYYPNVNPIHLVTQMQITYRDLFGLEYVPKSFKEKFLPGMIRWTKSLPEGHGIPLGSSMSNIMAPVGLIPIWLEIKKKFNVKFIVFVDDVLFLCKSDYDAREIWNYLSATLLNQWQLNLNTDKTYSGRFSKKAVTFCGWYFKGGYASIEQRKQEQFKERILVCIKNLRKANTRAFLKTINRKIDGFGNYYKFGNVLRQYEELDCFIRKEVRQWLSGNCHSKTYDNAELEKLGLHSLVICYQKAHRKTKTNPLQPRLRSEKTFYAEKPAAIDYGVLNQIAQNGEKLTTQLHELISLHRREIRLLEQIFNNY